MSFEDIEELMPRLIAQHQLVIALTFFHNKVWIRLSANVYNVQEDYVKLRHRLAQALQIEIK